MSNIKRSGPCVLHDGIKIGMYEIALAANVGVRMRRIVTRTLRLM